MVLFKFTNRQLDVIDILKNQTFSQHNLADMYQGAIMVKDIKENPDSIHQAAHSLRELQDYAKAFPFEVIECLSLVLKYEVKDDYILFEEKYKQILQELINLDNQELTEKVHVLVDFLVRRNLHNFRDLFVNSDKRAEADG